MSGGIGKEERATINNMGKNYNLEVIFANRSGAYLSNVDVEIPDRHQHKLLVTSTRDLLFFAN